MFRPSLALVLFSIVAGCVTAAPAPPRNPGGMADAAVAQPAPRAVAPTIAEVRTKDCSVHMDAFHDGCVVEGDRYTPDSDIAVHSEVECGKDLTICGETLRCACTEPPATTSDDGPIDFSSGPFVLRLCKRYGPCCWGPSAEQNGQHFQPGDGGFVRCFTTDEIIEKANRERTP